jgi:sugar phosphate isomerase/epimerase
MPFRGLALLLLCAVALPASAADVPHPKIDQAAIDKLGWKLSCQRGRSASCRCSKRSTPSPAWACITSSCIRARRWRRGRTSKFDHNATQEQIDAVLAKCKSAGVTPINYGVVGLPNEDGDARKVFDFAKKMGLKTIVSEPPKDAFQLVDRLASEYKINVAIHDHPKPSIYWNPDSGARGLQGRSQLIGACADVGHWYRSGLVPLECLKKLEGRIISLHFKDIAENKEDVVWGTGKCDVPAMMAEIKRQKIQPVFSIEYETGEGQELLNNVAKSIEFFSQQASELAK